MVEEIELLKEMEREVNRITPDNLEEKKADFTMAIRHLIYVLQNDYLKIRV